MSNKKLSCSKRYPDDIWTVKPGLGLEYRVRVSVRFTVSVRVRVRVGYDCLVYDSPDFDCPD